MADPASYRPAPGSIPTEPGVYRFSDPNGQVIYVGKAINLRNRLNSYFADPASLHFRTQTMVRTATKVEWTVVQNEVEALQLEYTWIKQYDPRFNIKYRDDKTYPWLCVTWSDEFPRVFVGRGPKRKGYRYFGPFGQAWAVRESVDLLLRVFPMRSCTNGVFRNARASGRPCLLGHIGKCAAPCVGRVSAEEHREIADDFCAFWSGQSRGLDRKLTKQMDDAAGSMEYERAAVLRDAREALRQATEKSAIVLPDGTDADVFAVAADPLEVAVQIFHIRSGRVRGERCWVADRADETDLPELIEGFCFGFYADNQGLETRSGGTIPSEIIVPVAPSSGGVLADLLGEQRGAKVSVHVPQRGAKKTLLETVTRNAEQALALHKTKRASDLATRSEAMAEVQAALGMTAPPLRIEGFDISHLQGTEVVGSMVVFEDGMARKSQYRRFVIKSFDGSNDIAAMDEVLRRRFNRLLADRAEMAEATVGGDEGPSLIDPTTGAPRRFAYAPGLVVVDGGLPQVNAAQQVLDDLGLNDEIMLIGLAKRLEEVWIPGEDFPLILPRASEGLYLLQRVRDESHRFAITHHRDRRSKAMVESVLDAVPGLGEVRRKTLLTHFSSLKKLRAASLDDLLALPGFGASTAQAVREALAHDDAGEAINTATGEVTELG
ncbi:excinuclease ABC subunit UvrC [Brooklawnia sp.]|uniref:excinuclease ABC subunit UvrC n=1 Tax=Brooklawnia sp. TaxID=2699740 RepID=UPI00311F67FF